MQWTAPARDELLERLKSGFAAARWPEPPAGFSRVGPLRPMRQVLRGRLPPEPGEFVVKWSRPVTPVDRLSRLLRAGPAVREGRVIRRLARDGLPTVPLLGFTDEGVDLLVSAVVPGLEALPAPEDTPFALATAVAEMLGRAFAAGLRHPDLHRSNLGLSEGRPILVDLGRARIARRGGLVRELARLQSTLADGVGRGRRLALLGRWLDAAGRERPGGRALRALVRRIDGRARRIARRYRRGRDRRATRTGRHFEVVRLDGTCRGIRRREGTEAWWREAAGWQHADPEGSRALKEGGRVVRFRRGPQELVLKRFSPVGALRLPRAVRSFRAAAWLENRRLPAPTALLALTAGRRDGFLVSEAVPGENLHVVAGERGGAALLPAARRDLARLVGRTLRRLHDAGLSHRDLKAPNLVLADAGRGAPALVVVDLEGLRRHRRGPSWRRRARDLARLDASLGARATDRSRALDAYLGPWPRLSVDRRRFVEAIARHVARKRGPSGRPR